MRPRGSLRSATAGIARVALFALVAACLQRPLEPGKGSPADATAPDGTAPPPVAYAVDLLVVVDNSGSMAEGQASMTMFFEPLLEALRSLPGGMPDLHLGVISTDLGTGPYDLEGSCDGSGGDGGQLLTGRCAEPLGARFVVDVAPAGCTVTEDATGYAHHDCGDEHCPAQHGARLATDPDTGWPRCRNFTADLEDVFACVGSLGTFGCGFEQPLESLHRALDPATGSNAGFLRADSVLAVVILTDEDDCSASDPALYDPAETGPDSPLGPMTSYRCLSQGLACDEPFSRTEGGMLHGCVPREDPGSLLHPISRYAGRLRALRHPEHLVLAAIAGPVAEDGSIQMAVNQSGEMDVLPSCAQYQTTSYPALRVRALLRAVHGEAGLAEGFHPICEPAFSDFLGRTGQRIGEALAAGGAPNASP